MSNSEVYFSIRPPFWLNIPMPVVINTTIWSSWVGLFPQPRRC